MCSSGVVKQNKLYFTFQSLGLNLISEYTYQLFYASYSCNFSCFPYHFIFHFPPYFLRILFLCLSFHVFLCIFYHLIVNIFFYTCIQFSMSSHPFTFVVGLFCHSISQVSLLHFLMSPMLSVALIKTKKVKI